MASKKSGDGKRSPTLPREVLRLITRKLRHGQREQEKLLISANQTTYSKMHDEVVANIRARALGAAFISVPLAAYHDVVANAMVLTKEWPGIVWAIIASTLEKTKVLVGDGSVLHKIVDEFSWAAGQRPFTLSNIDPERFKGMVQRMAGGLGIIQPGILAEFDRQLRHAAGAAQCGITNAANYAREDVGIAIEDYLLAQQVMQPGEDLPAPANVLPPSSKTGGPSPNCVLNPPKKVDDWFLAIRDMVLEFYKENRRCPNEAEAWARLRNNPPLTYGITSDKHNGEHAVFMHGQALGKRAFRDRWRRYTNANLRNNTQ